MAIAFLTSTAKSLYGSSSTTTNAINTTGADFIAVVVVWDGTAGSTNTVSDNQGNSWTPRTAIHDNTGTLGNVRIHYCASPTTNSSHTFTLTCSGTPANPAIAVAAFSGVNSTPYDVENGAYSGSPISTGSVTPTQDGSVLIAGVGGSQGTVDSINNGFTICGHGPRNPPTTYRTIGMAYKIQTTAAAINPAFTFGSGSFCYASIASFKPGGGGGGSQGAALHHYRQQGMMRHQQPRLILPNREIITELPRRRLIDNRLAT